MNHTEPYIGLWVTSISIFSYQTISMLPNHAFVYLPHSLETEIDFLS